MSKNLKDKKFKSHLSSYFLAQEENDPFENLRALQHFLRMHDDQIVHIKELQDKVDVLQKEKKTMKEKEKMMAKLFTSDNNLRSYRFASAFCPNCEMFKNYKKECPFCKFLEMTY